MSIWSAIHETAVRSRRYFSRKPRKLVASFYTYKSHSKSLNLTIRGVLFTYSQYEQMFPSFKKFQGHTFQILDTDELKLALRPLPPFFVITWYDGVSQGFSVFYWFCIRSAGLQGKEFSPSLHFWKSRQRVHFLKSFAFISTKVVSVNYVCVQMSQLFVLSAIPSCVTVGIHWNFDKIFEFSNTDLSWWIESWVIVGRRKLS